MALLRKKKPPGGKEKRSRGSFNRALHLPHRGDPVRIGSFTVLAGGRMSLLPADLREADLLIPLTEDMLVGEFGREYRVIAAPLKDFGGVPKGWEDFLKKKILPELEAGQRILAFCGAGHGRTGTFLASLVSLIEDKESTPDPIAAVRKRYCSNAVETQAQARAVFAIRGEELSQAYKEEFPEFARSFIFDLGGLSRVRTRRR